MFVCQDCDKEIFWKLPPRKEPDVCQNCKQVRANRNLRDKLQKYVLDYLEEHPCKDCGEKNSVVLEFDHVRGQKKYMISQMTRNSYSLTTLQEEIKKCEVVCANCHKLRESVRKNYHQFVWNPRNDFDTRVPRENQRKWVQSHKLKLVRYLENNPCIDCGIKDFRILEFDHVRGEKTANVSRMMNGNWEKVLEEIAKCDVVCRNCHRQRESLRQSWYRAVN